MSESGKAVFLSYASQDAEAAKKICDALRAAGVEVWFDQSELVGGDAWDQKIRKQIKECALLIPIISAATQARTEGYFRLEWRLADQRTHLMAKGRPFLLPAVIDDTRDLDAAVPDSFTEVQWTRLSGGETSPKFCERVKKLLGGEAAGAAPRDDQLGESRKNSAPATPRRPRWVRPALAGVVVLAIALGVTWQLESSGAKAEKSSSARQHLAAEAVSPQVAGLISRARVLVAMADSTRTGLDTAAGLLEQAARLEPGNATIFAEHAIVERRYFDEFIDRSPARVDAMRRRMAQAVSLDSTNPFVRMARAMVMARLSDDRATRDEAIALLETLAVEHPEIARVPLELGFMLMTDRPDVALTWFDRVAKVPGLAGVAHYGRAQVFLSRNDRDQAMAELDLALKAERATTYMLWKAYLLTIWEGKVAAAKELLDSAPATAFVEDLPAAARFFVDFRARDYDQALADMRAVSHDYIESYALAGPTAYYRGLALSRLGKENAAQIEWRSALTVVERRLGDHPTDCTLMQFKALLLSYIGDATSAQQIWKTQRELCDEESQGWVEPMVRMRLLPVDQAFDWLVEQVDKHSDSGTAAELRIDPVYDPVRADPRFPALLARAEVDPKLSPAAKEKPAAIALAPDKSVAVLAFANLSDDKANEYFSDGISEELLNVLAKVPGLKVTARTSSFHFKGKDTSIPEIARQLGVAYVVEGSVRKAGDKVRITAQLIKAADGFHVWSETFTRDLKDVFAVQDEIAGLVAKNLQLKLGTTRSGEVDAAEIEAYRLYWEARQAWNRRNPAGYDQAEALLNRALVLTPRFAKAHAALADVWELRGEWDDSIGIYEDRDGPVVRRLLAKVDEALALDPQCAEAYASRGNILGASWQYPAAEKAFRTAITLNPNFATAHQWLGRQLMNEGRLDEALALLKRATELDPLSQRILDNYAWALRHAGRQTEALGYLNRALALQPDAIQARSLQAAVLADLGRGEEAMAALRQVPDDIPFSLNFRLSALGRLGRKADIERLLPGIRDTTPRDRCLALALLGRTTEALATLKPERIFFSDTDLLMFESGYDSLRTHPEWNATMAAIGFTEAHARAQAWRQAHPPEKPEAKQ